MGILSRLGLMTDVDHQARIKEMVNQFNIHLARQIGMRTMAVDEVIAQLTAISVDQIGRDTEPVVIRMEFPRSFAQMLVQGDPQVSGFAIERIARRVGRRMAEAVAVPGDFGETGGSFL